jgi:hypothetical protein
MQQNFGSGQVRKYIKQMMGGSSLIGDKTFFNSQKILVSLSFPFMCVYNNNITTFIGTHAAR